LQSRSRFSHRRPDRAIESPDRPVGSADPAILIEAAAPVIEHYLTGDLTDP